jgi:hypothetical protein
MTTRTARSESPEIAAVRRALADIREVVIEDATAYWLGDLHGNPLGPESDRTLAPLAQGLAMIEAGADPATLAVWARLRDGGPYLVADDPYLVDFAEAAAGIPAKPRVLRE